MTTWNSRLLVVGVWVVLLAPGALFCQVRSAPPVRTRSEPPQVKMEKFRGEVLQMTPVAITVRDRENKNFVRTFNFDEKLAAKMIALVDRNRSYQHGDRVEIHFLAGTDTAVKIKGKPSRPRGGLR